MDPDIYERALNYMILAAIGVVIAGILFGIFVGKML